jgi:hypothetical protein
VRVKSAATRAVAAARPSRRAAGSEVAHPAAVRIHG